MIGQLYRRQRESIVAVALAQGESDPEVPACPGWTVSDVVRHLTGLSDDWLKGNLEVYASPEWTSAQVERFADLAVSEVAAEWAERSPKFEAILDNPTAADHLPASILTVVGPSPLAHFPAGVLVDTVLHHTDVAAAVGARASLDEPTLALTNRALGATIRQRWSKQQLPSVMIRVSDTAQEVKLAGDDSRSLALELSSLDLLLGFGGRKSVTQLQEMDWTGDEELVARVAPALVVPFFSAPS